MRCDACKKEKHPLKKLKLITSPPLCEGCFDFIILDTENHIVIEEAQE